MNKLAVAGILLIAVLIFVIDSAPLRRKKLTKELWVFSLLLLFATTLAITQVFHVKLPNPLDLMIYTFKPVSDRVDVWLK